jgi:hypothetical protein
MKLHSRQCDWRANGSGTHPTACPHTPAARRIASRLHEALQRRAKLRHAGRVQSRVGRPIGSATAHDRCCICLRPRIRTTISSLPTPTSEVSCARRSLQNRRAEAAARECLPVSQNAFDGRYRAWARSECRPRAEAVTDHACPCGEIAATEAQKQMLDMVAAFTGRRTRRARKFFRHRSCGAWLTK